MLNGLIIGLGVGLGWAWVRLMRGRALSWLGLPVLAALLGFGGWALGGGGAPWAALSLSLLACSAGAGLGAGLHSDWNTRKRPGLSLALLALSLEGALLLGWLGQGQSENASPSFVLLTAGFAAAMVAFREGVLPEQVRWRAGLRGSVALCAVSGVGLWWWHCEERVHTEVASLTADLVANTSHQGAWAVAGAAGLAGILLLGAAAQPWVRRFGAGLAMGLGVLLPVPTVAMRWVVQERCAEHLPSGPGLMEAEDEDPPIEIPTGWCRAPLTPSLECPEVDTLYQQTRGSSWSVRRVEADPMDTLWRHRWTRPGSRRGQVIRVDGGRPHLGSWLMISGNREPEDVDGTLSDLVDAVAGCGIPRAKAPAIVLEMVVAQSGEVRSVQAREGHSLSERELACVVDLARDADFPVSTCDGDQSLAVPLYAGAEGD